MKLAVKQKVDVDIYKRQLAFEIRRVIVKDYLRNDVDENCNKWFTKQGRTYAGNIGRLVSTDSKVAKLVDSMNILLFGRKLEVE